MNPAGLVLSRNQESGELLVKTRENRCKVARLRPEILLSCLALNAVDEPQAITRIALDLPAGTELLCVFYEFRLNEFWVNLFNPAWDVIPQGQDLPVLEIKRSVVHSIAMTATLSDESWRNREPLL